MLRIMRDYAGSWLIKAILGIIVIVFIFLGIGTVGSQRSGRAAMVNGDTITVEEYKSSYNKMLAELRERFGNNLNEEMLKMFQLEKEALNRLIDERIMLQEADKLDLRVSNQELADFLASIPVFQNNGVFDYNRYRSVLSQNRLTPESFEEMQKNAILIDKLRRIITESVKVSDMEAMQWYQWQNSEIDIDYVVFSPDAYKDIKFSDEDLKAYFDANSRKYMTEPMIDVAYIRFAPEKYRDKISVDEEEIKTYYDANIDEFKSPETVEARHILIKVDQDAADDAVQAAKKRADDIYGKAGKGEDFAELAKKYSEGPSRDNGGFLGAFTRKTMVKPFADKAFSMKAGDISEPVRTRFGWHVIKVEKVNPESVKDLAEASGVIRKSLEDEKIKTLAYDEADAVYEAVLEGDSLMQAASSMNHELNTIENMTRKGPEKGISDPEAFASVAFSLQLDDTSDIQDIDGVFYILQLMKRIEAEIPGFDSVKDDVENDFIKEKQRETAEKEAGVFAGTIKNVQEMKEAADKRNMELKTTGFFKRNTPVPGIGYEPALSESAFGLSKDEQVSTSPVVAKNSYYVIGLKDRKAPDADGFNDQKNKIVETLLKQKQSVAFGEWIDRAKAGSEITLGKGFKNL